ncbi:MAG: Hpt domain-containing protein [Flavobacteriaceae bacterium]
MEQPNLNYIKELSEGDASFEEKLIRVLKRELPEEYAQFLKSFEEKKFKKTAEDVHKLKHKISILGLVKGYELAATFEKNLKERGDTSLNDSFRKIIEAMIDFIKPL